MPLDSLDFPQNHLLAKLGRVERLLATERQWCKGKLRDGDGRHCLVGAIEAADAWPEVGRVILRAAREVSGKRFWRIESFNDDPRTKHADILAALRRARQNIIADMEKEYELKPWRSEWVQVLRNLTRRYGNETGAMPAADRKSPPIDNELAVRHGSSRPQLRLIGEHSEVS
jgi:hypothetical protein